MLANPYANPYLNPFLNPYMAQYSTSPGNAALFFFAAQQANGGIGSGRLSGVRPVATSPARSAQARMARASDVPGAGAARYFNRGPQPGGGTDPRHNRVGRYYPNHTR
jgi:hypothetical protein